MKPSEIQPLPAHLADALSRASAYPYDATAARGVTTQQTHISYLFFTPDRVYKLRKAVNPGFLDFATRRARNEDCLREVALNRRLARDVYLGVAEIRAGTDGVSVGPVQEQVEHPEVEHCVVMRRLPEGTDSLTLLADGRFGEGHIDAVATAIARFHDRQGLGAPAPFAPDEWLNVIAGPVEVNLEHLEAAFQDERPIRLARAARDFLNMHADRFEVRRRDGRAVDGHGDLHLAHVWFGGDLDEPLFIDCIEFSDRLRRIDGASEVAFLAMDLAYRGQSALADRFLRRYARATDDFHLYAVVDYFLSYRAAVRAKVAVMASEEEELPNAQRGAARESASRHLDLALASLTASQRGALVLVAGIVGTGKSSAAEVAADTLGGVVIASDRVRKRLAGMAATARPEAAVDEGIYTQAHSERVYRGLLDRAQPVVAAGRVAILDATFSRPAHREAVAAFARARRLPLLILETRCRREVTLKRLAERQRIGRDPSDAGPAFYPESASRFAPVEAPAYAFHLAIDTEPAAWREELRERIRAWWEQAGTRA